MKRETIVKLIEWKQKPGRKPLILKGARQVGKTYLLEQFGKEHYLEKGGKYVLADFKENPQLTSAFSTHNPIEILKYLQLALGVSIDIKKDLLILDEIQECEGAISSLKYFHKQMPTLDIIAAGSHLGLLKNEESFPIGYVNFLPMFPMSFTEVLKRIDPLSHELYSDLDVKNLKKPINSILHQKLLEMLRIYFFTGGLPEVVKTFADLCPNNLNEALQAAREIQLELVEGYKADFVKYSGLVNAGHILHVFEAIPSQLAEVQDEEVKKFRFNKVIPKRKGFESIVGPLTWLEKSRLCIKSLIAAKSGIPLAGHSKANKFKLYIFDVGLLNAMLRVNPVTILQDQLGSYKGFIAENFVAQELFALFNSPLNAWQEGRSEIEFLLPLDDQIIPLEVKSSHRSRRAKSLDAYINRYHPSLAYKLTGQNFGLGPRGKFVTLPLYCCSKVFSSQ